MSLSLPTSRYCRAGSGFRSCSNTSLVCIRDSIGRKRNVFFPRPRSSAAARALKPMHERPVFGRSVLLFDHIGREQLAGLGDVRTPSIADLFVAVMSNNEGQPPSHEATARQGSQRSEVREINE